MVMDEMGGSIVGLMQNSTAQATGATTSYSSSVFTNYPLLSAVLAFAISQSSKFISSRYKEMQWDLKQFVESGGMPSSHSASVTALAVAVGFQEGFGGSPFSVTLIFALVVMYDITGVRSHAGSQAEVLNQIICELPSEHPLAESRPLRDLLGHIPPQVAAGAMQGAVCSCNCPSHLWLWWPSLILLDVLC